MENDSMRMNLTEKAKRLLEFLFVVQSNPRIYATLRTRGFGPEAIQEGWRLLIRASGSTIGLAEAPGYATDSRLVDALDGWENEWYPIAEAVLERRFPAQHATVFAGLSQTEGPALVVSVGLLLERLAALPQDVLAVLATHGLTAQVLGEATALIQKIRGPEVITPTAPLPDEAALAKREEERAQAETDMWGFYLMWSAIARSRIKNKRLLRLLGFGTGTSSDAGTPERDAGGTLRSEGETD